MPSTRSSTRSTRSSVLGKRPQRPSESSLCEQQLQTPESTPNPKRARVSTGVIDGDSNKENVPPLLIEAINIELMTSRSTNQTTTESITPTRTRPTNRRHVSTPVISSRITPTRDISLLAISTPPPTPPTTLIPIHVRARTLLRSTCNSVNIQIAGRESERATIIDFLSSFLDAKSDDAQSTSLYISGSPGTGKTALVNSILHELNSDAKIIFINCMALNNIESLWERLVEEFDGRKQKSAGRSNKSKGRDAVERLLSSHSLKCIVILDELDHIAPTAQALTSLFSLPNIDPTTLRLIGIANTHTLTSSSTTSAIVAASNVRTLHFAPYTSIQLLQILRTRLSPLHDNDSTKTFLPVPTLTLLTKKIAALTGDVRSLFEVLRGAVDLAVTASASPTPSGTKCDILGSPSLSVTPTHVLAALKAYTPSSTSPPTTKSGAGPKSPTAGPSSEIITKVSNLGLQARLVLLCILLASKRLEANLSLTSGVITSSPKKPPASPIKRSASLPNTPTVSNGVGIEPTQLHTYYSSVLNRNDSGGFEAVSRSEFGDLVGVLEGIGLISMNASSDTPANGGGARRGFGRSTSFSSGAGFAGVGKGKGKGRGDIKLAIGIRADEVLRGLGVTTAGDELDAKAEEVRAVWQQENARLGRDLNAIERGKQRATIVAAGFEGASED